MTPEPVAPAAPAADETKQFLDALFAGKSDAEFILIWLLKGKRSAWFANIQAAADYVQQHSAQDVYVGVAVSAADHGPYVRLKIEGNERMPSSIIALWADLDIAGEGHKETSSKHKHYAPNEAAARSIMFSEFPPTLLVHSGGGLQAWWLFRELWTLESEEEVRKASALATRWLGALRARAQASGWTIDGVADLTRVLRVPSTANCKVPGNPRPVRLLEEIGRAHV